ncbi:hypothetical protein ACKQTC_00540 [Peptococcus simiae]|uniref:Uncharacterized protein n=1 Tax=Peptococcus simiae TaxID=1643805 RepID=A0ABW9GW93_9FIRM
MADLMTALVYGEECDKALEDLLHYLRTTLQGGYLDIFAHRFQKRSIFAGELSGFGPLHDQACQAMDQLIQALKNAQDFTPLFANTAFCIQSLEIMANRLARLDPRKDMTGDITRVENIQNNLKSYLRIIEDRYNSRSQAVKEG